MQRALYNTMEFGLLVAAFSVGPAWAAEGTLLVRANASCRWSLDGKPRGVLKPQDRVSLSLLPGEHLIEAVALSGGFRWERMVTIEASAARVLTISLSIQEPKTAPEELRKATAQRGYWEDPVTGLMWPAKDNGSGTQQEAAGAFCAALDLGGFHDWRMPQLAELESLYDPEYSIKGGIERTAYFLWSSSRRGARFAWGFTFDVGERESDFTGETNDRRVLCVRRARNQAP